MMIAVAKLNTTTSACFTLDALGRKPAFAAQVKKLSMARERQYRDISILLLFFSIASARPVGNIPIATIGMLHLSKILKSKQVQPQADVQYMERNRLDLAVPIRLFTRIL